LAARDTLFRCRIERRRGAAMTKPLKAADYLDNPQRAIALLNRVIASGGDIAVIEKALVVVALALKRAGFGWADDHGCIRNPD
jgi:hypothetical protein